jgi:hypothetical protein
VVHSPPNSLIICFLRGAHTGDDTLTDEFLRSAATISLFTIY